MKLAFCLFKYFPFGGLQRDFIKIATECLRRNHSVDVYTFEWTGEIPEGINLHVLPAKGWQNHTRCRDFVKRLQSYLSRTHYDVVVGFNKMPGLDLYYAADSCYQAKLKLERRKYFAALPRYRHLIAYEKAVFDAHSHTKILLLAANRQAEFQQYYDTPSERFRVLPPGISENYKADSTQEATRADVRNEFSMKPEDYFLLFVGSGFRTKGLDRALLGIAALPLHLKKQIHFLIIGQDKIAPFQKLAIQLKIQQQVHFLGGRFDTPRFFFAADFLLHPAYNENTGNVLLEALAAGLPVLTTDQCGFAHHVEAANAGIVIPSPFQQTHFNNVLKDMLTSRKRPEWQKNGLTYASENDIYSLFKRAADLIES